MLNLSNLNYLAILVSGITAFVIGAIWYTVLFGKLMESIDKEEGNEPHENSPVVFGLSFVCMVIMMFGLNVLIKSLGINSLQNALGLGSLVALSLISASIGINILYQFKSYKSFLLDAGFQSVFIVVGTIIMTIWK
jgi:hypothetical protein